MTSRADITQQDLWELFEYYPETGVLLRLSTRRRVTTFSGRYLTVSVHGWGCLVHRVVWCMHYGAWPKYEIDHRNGLEFDNRICNLRDVTHEVNMQNRFPYLGYDTTDK